MKYIAVFFILNMLLLSSISGIAGIHHGPATCCKESIHKDCGKQQMQTSDRDCPKGICNVMLSCGTCGFIISLPVSLSPAIIDLNNQTTPPFIADKLSDYQNNDWNPPKV
jgi:hypothetical protein